MKFVLVVIASMSGPGTQGSMTFIYDDVASEQHCNNLATEVIPQINATPEWNVTSYRCDILT